MKSLCLLAILLVTSLCFSCRGRDEFNLTKEAVLKDALRDGGEVVNVVGDTGPFKYAGTFHGNYVENPDDANGSGGINRAGHSMNFEIGTDYFHRIHIYDNESGGALLVGVRHPVDDQDKKD